MRRTASVAIPRFLLNLEKQIERERWTTLEECNWRRTFVCTKMLPAPPTSRKMAKLLCSHIEPYILEQVMIYPRILLKTKCNKMLKSTEAEVPWDTLRYGASWEICTINHIIWIWSGGFQKLLLYIIWICHTIPKVHFFPRIHLKKPFMLKKSGLFYTKNTIKTTF